MQFQLNSEQQLLQDSLRRFLEKEYDFEARNASVAHSPGGSSQNWSVFAENGWLAAALPEDMDGFGGSVIETAIVAHEFGRALVVEPYLGCAVLGPQTLLAGGTPDQLAELMPAVADGTLSIALAYSEPASRGLPVPISTNAKPVNDGYVINGRKSLVIGSAQAQKIIVSATVSGTEDIGLFLVDANASNLVRTRLPLHDGTLAEELLFSDVHVPTENRLSESVDGLSALKEGLAHGIVALCSGLVGSMERAIEITAEYLKTRQQFGLSIGSFQVLQHRMADMATEMELARSMLFAGMAAIEAGPSDQRDQMLSNTKSIVGRAAKYVCGQAIQLHGGIGMTDEYIVGHYFKHAVVADLLLGSASRHEAEFAATIRQECKQLELEQE